MTAPNRNTLWAEAFVDELARGGVSAVCITPGSRSTPLTVAFDRHEDVRVLSHLDERSSAFFALGRARRTGELTPLVCTSGTAAASQFVDERRGPACVRVLFGHWRPLGRTGQYSCGFGLCRRPPRRLIPSGPDH